MIKSCMQVSAKQKTIRVTAPKLCSKYVLGHISIGMVAIDVASFRGTSGHISGFMRGI